jgi:uncharacterized protein with von Willebrand factor type A (vWA) domain
MLVDFVDELREAGLPAGTGDLLTFGAAMKPLDPTDVVDLYWAGRAALVKRRDHIPVYDRVFRRFFLDDIDEKADPLRRALKARAETASALEIPATEPDPEGRDRDDEATTLGLQASDAELLRDKTFAECTPEELAAVRRMVARLRLAPPCHRTRRTAPASDGLRPDMRRTIRETMRAHGATSELFWRRRRVRPRPLVLILDVSGSMADYSRNLLQFAYSARRANTRVEVFCFGTRLTRITKKLERRRPDDAMAQAARAVFDWEGGTRIGESLDAFVRDWGRLGTCRRGIVVICSDGLDRGDPEVLAGAMERLARLSHRLVWMNPHVGDDAAFAPSTLGMMVAAPHVDEIVSGHDLRSLERFAARLPALR